jgi:hypothetical protein
MAKQGNIEKIFPLAGMNSDDDPRYFQEGDYLEALNTKVGSNHDQGDDMLAQTLKSTLQINLDEFTEQGYLSDSLAYQKFECLGTAIDKKNNISYIFGLLEWDPYTPSVIERNFIIWKHNMSNDTNKIILNKDASTWGIIPWGSDMQRIEAEVVNDKLVFTDYTNNIRMLDVNRMEVSTDNEIDTTTLWEAQSAYFGNFAVNSFIYYTDKVYKIISDTTGSSTIPPSAPTLYEEICNIVDCYLDTDDPELFILAASPPLLSPVVSYSRDSSVKSNKLKGSIWQFSYRYIYMDYRKSKYAPPSLIDDPSGEEYNSGAPNEDITKNNRLRVICYIRNSNVRAVEVVGRSSDDPATWFLIKKVYVVDDSGVKNYSSAFTVNFYNDESKIPISISEVYELFTYVPIRAKTLSLIDGNRLVFGNIQENYPLIDTDVTVSLAWQTAVAADPINKYRVLKKGVTHQWGIVYRDIAGRITSIMAEEQMRLYIPFVTESTDSNIDRIPNVSFNINHLPHPYSVSYQIVKLGNSLNGGNTNQLKFWQLIGYVLLGKINHTDPSTGSNSNSSVLRIRIDYFQDLQNDRISGWSVEDYRWKKGDRIRIIGRVAQPPGPYILIYQELTQLYDLELTGEYRDTDYISMANPSLGTYTEKWVYFNRVDGFPTEFINATYVEIYRPLTSDSNLYFTTSMIFEIGTDANGNKYHKGNTNQALNALGAPSTPAIVTNTSHDTWLYLRSFASFSLTINYIWAESDYASDYYETEKMTSQGQPLIDINISGTGVLPERLRHGGTLEIGTQINNIDKFDYDDYKDLEVRYGAITKIVLVEFILKAVQEHKVTSIYISRLESFTAANQPTYTFTDTVFGTVRPFKEDWGSKHPGSIIVEDGVLYFWDSNNRIIVENDYNGQVAISNIKMSRLFADLADTLNASLLQNQWVEFAVNKDDFNNTEIFCLFGTGTSTKRIYVFNTRSKRWTYKVDTVFNYSKFYWNGNQLYHFALNERGRLYRWFAGADYQVISGDQRNGSLNMYSPSGDMRIFNTIIVYQDGATPVFTSVNVPKKVSGANRDMSTYIYAVNIEEKEGFYYCAILNDINTPGTGTQNDKLMNGDVLRGLLLNIVMSFTGNDKITLSNIEIVTTHSKLKN